MRVYIITEAEMEQLRQTCKMAFLEACATRNVNPHLMGTAEHDMWSTFNFHYCRWRTDVGQDYPHNIMPQEQSS